MRPDPILGMADAMAILADEAMNFERRHAAAIGLRGSAPEPPFMVETRKEQGVLARESASLSTEPR